MTVTYENANWALMAQPAHHLRQPQSFRIVEAEGYPRLAAQHKDKATSIVYRGIDKRVAKEWNSRYNGAELRRLRAIKGIGRPICRVCAEGCSVCAAK